MYEDKTPSKIKIDAHTDTQAIAVYPSVIQFKANSSGLHSFFDDLPS